MLCDTGFYILAPIFSEWRHVLRTIMLSLFLLVHSVRIWNNASRFNDDMTGISAVSCQISLGKKRYSIQMQISGFIGISS
jgi:hypothetical protein